MKGFIFIMVDGTEAETACEGPIFIIVDRTDADSL